MKTTLKAIRSHDPCKDSWENLLESLNKTKADETEIEIKYILDTLGVEDAIWALRAVKGHDKEIRLIATDFAESVLHIFEKEYPEDKRPREAIQAVRDFANGKINEDQLEKARDAARDAAWTAAWATELEKQKHILLKYI